MTEAQLIDKWGLTIAQSSEIFTWTEPLTLAWLAEQASKANLVIEVGVYMGRSARVMLDAGAGHLFAIDPFMVAGTENVARYWLKSHIINGRCEVIPKHTEPATEMLQHLKEQADLIFVDDGHATEDVKRDIRCMLPLLRSGGLLCGHDFDVPHNDVALGVIASLPSYEIPIPRLWAYRKP